MSRKPPWGWAGLGLWILGCVAVAADGAPDRPVDYRHVVVTAWWTLVFCSVGVVVAAGFLLAARSLRPVPSRVAAVVAVVGLVAVVAACGFRGVVTPWAPAAHAVDSACRLSGGGLDALPPDTPRRKVHDETDAETGHVVSSRCDWMIGAGTVAMSVWLHRDERFTSGVRAAADAFVARRAGLPDGRSVAGIGDEASEAARAGGVTVTARRANVLVEATVDGVGPTEAGRLAEALARRMAGAVRVGR